MFFFCIFTFENTVFLRFEDTKSSTLNTNGQSRE